jgi:hypothetical protein
MLPTGFPINVAGIDWRGTGVAEYGLKRDAAAALAKLRASGRNVEPCVEAVQASTHISRRRVITRPDPLSEFTWMMRPDGTWCRGRLTDQYDKPARWQTVPTPEPIPATFTHVTRTVVDSHNRHERYRTKSNGSCGRWVRSDESIAICACGWRSYGSTRAEAQAAGRAHRTAQTSAATVANR